MQPESNYEKALVVHAASSCTYPADYYNLMKTIVHPYWAKDPPQHRLSNKEYKTVDHHTAWVPEESLVFKVSRALPYDIILYRHSRMCCNAPDLWIGKHVLNDE